MSEVLPEPFFDDGLSEILFEAEGEGGEIILLATVDPSGEYAANEGDPVLLGHRMAAAGAMAETLGEVSNWLVEKYASTSYKADRSMWRNQSAFALYERVNETIQKAEGAA